MNRDLISVIMAVYNSEKYLREAIESILRQTYRNIEFIIINDGSTDSSLQIIESYLLKDDRIKLVNNTKNEGLIYSLNKGLDLAKGKYIARMDSDDISEKIRLKEQYEFMEKNKNVAVLSTNIRIFKEKNKILTKKITSPKTYEIIKVKLFFGNCLCHPTIMFRKSILDKENFRYSINDYGMEDYGMWNRISNKYRIENLERVLLDYRIVKTSITSQENKKIEGRYRAFTEAHKLQFKLLGIAEENMRTLFEIQLNGYIDQKQIELEQKEKFLLEVISKNNERNIYDKKVFNRECAEKFMNICLDEKMYFNYIKSELSQYKKISKVEFKKMQVQIKIKNYIKRMLRS